LIPVLICIGFIAVIYASIGHGGASGYMAVLVLFGYEIEAIRPLALLLNLLVAGVSFYAFKQRGYFDWKLIAPFIIGSVPAAFMGSQILLESQPYKLILGSCLLVATLRIAFPIKKSKREKEISIFLKIVIGISIGLLSGMIGIGGGILLSPLLLLLGLAGSKKIAAASALFIWVNSFAGLSGLLLADSTFQLDVLPILLIATAGALLGGLLGSRIYSGLVLQRVLAVVLLLASIKLIFI
ncbi:MAG: TSUP family transporter, partial [Bacteroidota bacterium]